ncbi:MAG: cell division protein SepF [Clostridia bacterium]|nr:cell division protein SepF [Clostridia bacterium]
MGIFDKLLKAIGFEDKDNGEIIEKTPEKVKKDRNISINSKFNLKDIEKQDIIEEKLYFPKTQEDIEIIARDLSNGNNVKVNFIEFAEEDRIRALDFLSGVIYILNGEIEKLEKTIYLLKINKN